MSIYPKKGPRLSKKLAERRHSVRRALQRYKIELTRDRRKNIIKLIQNGEGHLIERQSRRLSLWSVNVPGLGCGTVKVIYDKNRKEIVTFLPN